MKKIICNVEYDTDSATLVAKHTVGEFGDPAGYEETLYVTAEGKYFLYLNGGRNQSTQRKALNVFLLQKLMSGNQSITFEI